MAKGTTMDSSDLDLSVLFLKPSTKTCSHTVRWTQQHQQHNAWSEIQQVAFIENVRLLFGSRAT